MRAAVLVLLLAAPAAANLDRSAGTKPEDVALELKRLRALAAEAKPSAGTGVFYPYEAVKAGVTGYDGSKAALYGLARCAQVQAVSARGAYHFESFQVAYALRGVEALIARDGNDPTDGGRARMASWRARLARLTARRAALESVTVEDGLGPLASLAPAAGTDYHVIPANCPPPDTHRE